MLHKSLTEKQLLALELAIAVLFCFVPLFFNNPYRINIFLSWEGAYRLYLGQMPFRDFSLPMGYGYWVIPALFFKIFGPYMASLIKAQVLINLVSVIAFRSILRLFQVQPVVIFFSVLVFCFSYVSFNFWPWYNHTVFVLELVAFYFILRAILKSEGWRTWLSLALGAFFIFFSLFTKQDAGGIGMAIVYGMLTYDAFVDKSLKKWLVFTGILICIASMLVLPLMKYDFSYWFNHGQPPHHSRLVLQDFLNQILGWAYWEKFFLLIILLFVLDKIRLEGRSFFYDKREALFAFLCITILLQAFVIPVTSPVPPKNEVFFYAFGFAYCMASFKLSLELNRLPYTIVCSILLVFWWTGIYWRNVQRLVSEKPAVVVKTEKTARHRYRLAREYKTMENLYLSEETLEGIKKIQELDVVKNTGKKDLKVLNMSELTSLAYELGFTPLVHQPLWFHQNVAVFQREVDEFCRKIRNKEYDVVLFESIPPTEVVNFFPEDVKRCLQETYRHEFTFLAPRTPEVSYIDVFTRP